MTDTSTGFSNPAYNVISEPGAGAGGGGGQEGAAGEPGNNLANGKQLSRSNSLGEDPDHIEVNNRIIRVIELQITVQALQYQEQTLLSEEIPISDFLLEFD